ncbi:unnamed protein product [Albugo candida]|uniref:Uncharacterized protein n=1 Tax=Albugo candida TaxID=65357 RepID=A0A024GTK8_9STRA|nr:unnamed protein product [Albugo candida]|eukprot:CCI49692.1 unnamed protein product [Albugo candida]
MRATRSDRFTCVTLLPKISMFAQYRVVISTHFCRKSRYRACRAYCLQKAISNYAALESLFPSELSHLAIHLFSSINRSGSEKQLDISFTMSISFLCRNEFAEVYQRHESATAADILKFGHREKIFDLFDNPLPVQIQFQAIWIECVDAQENTFCAIYVITDRRHAQRNRFSVILEIK